MRSKSDQLWNNKFQKYFSDQLSGATPGVQVGVVYKGKIVARMGWGQVYRFYDLASLTKILFTTTAFMDLVETKNLNLQCKLQSFLPHWNYASTTLAQLLSHNAGQHWWYPFYKKINRRLHPKNRRQQLYSMVCHKKVDRQSKHAIYSDLDFFLLGGVLEKVYLSDLYSIWLSLHQKYKFKDLFFHPYNKRKYAKSEYAPTEKCSWRKTTLQGWVHDENAFALGGVSTHAGLFGSLDGVLDWGIKLRNGFFDESPRLADVNVVHNFAKRQLPVSVGDWGYGFMKPTKGSASCGRRFSLQSFGHTGFTGTSLWMDPTQDLLVVILSNRVHPTRDNKRFVSLRPQIHDWIYSQIISNR